MEMLIRRAAMALGVGVSQDELRNRLLKSGHSEEEIRLAIAAAIIANKDGDSEGDSATD